MHIADLVEASIGWFCDLTARDVDSIGVNGVALGL